jgi:hypothetical protein
VNSMSMSDASAYTVAGAYAIARAHHRRHAHAVANAGPSRRYGGSTRHSSGFTTRACQVNPLFARFDGARRCDKDFGVVEILQPLTVCQLKTPVAAVV